MCAGDSPPGAVGDPDRVAARMAARRRLRLALGEVELLPEATGDDLPPTTPENGDQEYLRNRPPHHG